VVDMNNKMLGSKPLYVALAQRKEDRKAQLASQYMQRLAARRMQNPTIPGMYAPANGGFFVPGALQGQRAGGFMPQMGGAQMRGGAPRWNAMGAAGFNPLQAGYMMQGQYGQMGRGPRVGGGMSGMRQPGQFGGPNAGGRPPQTRLPGVMGQGQAGIRQLGYPQAQPGKGMMGGQPGQMPLYSYPMGMPQQRPMGMGMQQMQPGQQMQQQGQQAGIVVHNQEPLTTQMLAAAQPQEQKQMLGERLYPLISRVSKDSDAGKITGMMLEMDNAELLMMLENEELLQGKVNEALSVLESSKPAV